MECGIIKIDDRAIFGNDVDDLISTENAAAYRFINVYETNLYSFLQRKNVGCVSLLTYL